MERGVVVGGLMICGSFLLAALLNRSAMEEVTAPVATPPAAVPQAPHPNVAADCERAAGQEAPDTGATPAAAAGSDLMVNGFERCPR